MRSSLMFILVVAFAPTFQVEFTQEQIEGFKKFNLECLEETQVDLSLALESTKGKAQDDPKLKDFFFCMNKRVGLQNRAGEIQKDTVRSLMSSLDEEVINKILDQCTDKKESPQETAFYFMECSRKVIVANK